MSEKLGDRERALSDFFKEEAEMCRQFIDESFPGREGLETEQRFMAACTVLVSAERLMRDIREKLNLLSFLADQEEGVRVATFRDLEEGRTLNACLLQFKELREDTNLPPAVRRHMEEKFAVLNKEHVFEL